MRITIGWSEAPAGTELVADCRSDEGWYLVRSKKLDIRYQSSFRSKLQIITDALGD
jgi:hypothetical protein